MNSTSLVYTAPAKLNLFLHINHRQETGYHHLQSVFVRINLADQLWFSRHDNNLVGSSHNIAPVILTNADHITKNPHDNLITKAADVLFHHLKQHHNHASYHITPITIHLDKQIPTGAGLGGGSSNAATTLLALNELWGAHLDTATLTKLALQLGADVPFFIHKNHAMSALGVGELLTPIAIPRCRFLLLTPSAHNSTTQLFAHPDLIKNTPIIHQVDYRDFLHHLHPPYFNAFESIALTNPHIAIAMDYLRTKQAKAQSTARLTGTGSAVFLPISDAISDETLQQWQIGAPCSAVVAQSY